MSLTICAGLALCSALQYAQPIELSVSQVEGLWCQNRKGGTAAEELGADDADAKS